MHEEEVDGVVYFYESGELIGVEFK